MDEEQSAPSSLAVSPRAFRWELVSRAGEGASAVVWKARDPRTGALAALKIARGEGRILQEAGLVARIGCRWTPALLDAGVVPKGVSEVAAGARFLALEWTPGESLDVAGSPPRDAVKVATMVAHGVGRALCELHVAGVRHGDVKPSNVLLSGHVPRRDRASERGATLIDLGLAAAIAGDSPHGGTPRYLPPELSRAGELGPDADVFALGLVLAEILDANVARARDPLVAIAAWRTDMGGPEREIATWVEAMLSATPGARPSASWVADRAARALGLLEDEAEGAAERGATVKRAYLAVRGHEIRAGARIAPAIAEPARGWLEEACSWAAKTGFGEDPAEIEPIGALGRARWLVSLVGPAASSWAMEATSEGEGALAERLTRIARDVRPSAWTLDDVAGRSAPQRPRAPTEEDLADDRWARLMGELARPSVDPEALARAENALAAGSVPRSVVLALGRALIRAGEIGRAWVALAEAKGDEADGLRADVARRRGDPALAAQIAARIASSPHPQARSSARATLARLCWDRGDLGAAEKHLEGAEGALAAEMHGLVAYRRGTLDAGLRVVTDALSETRDADSCARLLATRGMLEHARGDAEASLSAFAHAAELATRAGAIVEEATYLTGEAAAATDAGAIDRALRSATRAALLWERLGREADAARAWLSRAGALSAVGARHAAEEAAAEAIRRATLAGDARAVAFARLAIVETRAAGDLRARSEAIAADAALSSAGEEDRARVAARLLSWAPDAIDAARIAHVDRQVATFGASARWEWWGARASAFLGGLRASGDSEILGALRALIDARAPLSSRGPALDAAVRLATEQGDGDAARRFEGARAAAARTLRDGTPAPYRASLASVAWARGAAPGVAEVTLESGQIAQLEAIVRALGTREGLKPLFEQVLDTMILWTGVERGLLLLCAPDGRLVPRAARNLARRDLSGEQLALSQGIARRAAETGEPVVATDAFSTLGDLHASVHALRLRSVLAVPLLARGQTLGVVYLDDRARKGAFGARELAWVRLVASQAATAIADARDQVLLKRAIRRAERARASLATALAAREAELYATRAELELTRGDEPTRFPYDAIAGRSEAMRATLRLVDRVTASDVPVLLIGESGTGKELIARAVHANGPRARRAFVSENCAAVPEALLESTLFGHVKGAFTGASATRAGLFDVADGGTLFLDEIGEMPLSMQTKLLRVLQDGELRAVGGERTRRVDVRVLGATHRDLAAMVAAKTFREDLFYRLNVITVRVPSLRERAEDIPILVTHFIAKHAGGRPLRVTRAAMDKLLSYPWPGNVRQLENEIRRALVLADDKIDVAELSADVVRGGPSAARGTGLDMRSRVDALEGELLKEALAKTNGNQTRAAEILGLSRFGLQKMMKRLSIGAH